MYDYSSPYGESCYRLMSRTGEFIYLRTRGYLDIDRDTNQVRTFVCVNALVGEDEGKKLIREMKKKFTIMIQEAEISTNEPDVPAVENPAQLERAIISLITNLHHANAIGSSGSVSGLDASPEAQSSNDGHESDTNRNVKSPPIELIPPKPSSIRTSIVRSMDVVGSSIKGSCRSNDEDDDDSEDDVDCNSGNVSETNFIDPNSIENSMNDAAASSSSTRASVLHRNVNLKGSDDTITSKSFTTNQVI